MILSILPRWRFFGTILFRSNNKFHNDSNPQQSTPSTHKGTSHLSSQ